MSAERVRDLLELLEDEPDDPLLRFTLGGEYLSDGDPGAAARELARVLELDPRYTVAYRHLGSALQALGRSAEAIATWERGIAVSEETGDLQAGKEMRVLLARAQAAPR